MLDLNTKIQNNMKKLIILPAIFLSALSVQSQSISRDAEGNYIAVKTTKDSTGTSSAKPTGKTYTDTKGNK